MRTCWIDVSGRGKDEGNRTMPRVCTICTHPEREAIDQALVGTTNLREIAALYRVSDDAITRHRGHMLVPLVQAQEVRAAVEAETARDSSVGSVFSRTSYSGDWTSSTM